jgi:serine/threonine-protein kinase
MDPVGQIVGGKYRVVRRIGGGGVADVYEAVHEEIGQRAAVKVLKREYAKVTELNQRFLIEAQAASKIGHPGVVQIYDIGRFPTGEPYLIMEFLDGEELADVLSRKQRLGLEEAIGVCLHVLHALEAAHRAGIVHRDLKPENIVLVRGPDGQPWAKIIDFGIAHLAREGGRPGRTTAVGSTVGTPYYISPEQARGKPNIDGRADLYAIGVMLYELLTGAVPFDGQTIDEILARTLTEPFPSVRVRNPDLPEAVDAILQKATAKRPEQRYATADEFAAALRPLRGETVSVKILEDDDDPMDITSIRRLRDLAAAPPARRFSSAPPPPRPPGATPSSLPARPGSVPPPPPGPAFTPARVRRVSSRPGISVGSATPTPPGRPAGTSQHGTDAFASDPYLSARPDSLAPPPPASHRSTVIIATVVASATAAAVAVGLALLLADRREASPPPPASPAPPETIAAVAEPAPPPTPPGTIPAVAEPEGSAEAPDAGGPSPVDVETDEDVGTPETPDGGDAGPPRDFVSIKLVGLPDDARVTLDGRPVESAFDLPRTDRTYTLRVAARGFRPYVTTLRAQEDVELPVRLEDRGSGTVGPAADAGGGGSAPPDAGSAGPGPSAGEDAGTRPQVDLLANPFADS